MKITIANYENYALDYIEGNLSPRMQEAMRQFLAKNPAIAAEFEGLEAVVLVPDETVVYAGKASLKREAEVVALPSSRRRTMLRIALVAAALMGVFILGPQLFETTEKGTTPVVEVSRGGDSLENESTPIVKEAIITDIANKEDVPEKNKNVTGFKEEKNIATGKAPITSSPSPKTLPPKTFHKKKPILVVKEAIAIETPKPKEIRIIEASEENTPIVKEEVAVEIIPESPKVIPDKVEKNQITPTQQEELTEPVALEETAGNKQPIVAVEEEELTNATAQNAGNSRKKARRVTFFPKLKEKFSPESLRDALLPEAITSDSK